MVPAGSLCAECSFPDYCLICRSVALPPNRLGARRPSQAPPASDAVGRPAQSPHRSAGGLAAAPVRLFGPAYLTLMPKVYDKAHTADPLQSVLVAPDFKEVGTTACLQGC